MEWHHKYLDRAAESIKNQHELNCGITEYLQAAELFLFSANENDIRDLINLDWFTCVKHSRTATKIFARIYKYIGLSASVCEPMEITFES